jgi:hypothetical protein
MHKRYRHGAFAGRGCAELSPSRADCRARATGAHAVALVTIVRWLIQTRRPVLAPALQLALADACRFRSRMGTDQLLAILGYGGLLSVQTVNWRSVVGGRLLQMVDYDRRDGRLALLQLQTGLFESLE